VFITIELLVVDAHSFIVSNGTTRVPFVMPRTGYSRAAIVAEESNDPYVIRNLRNVNKLG